MMVMTGWTRGNDAQTLIHVDSYSPGHFFHLDKHSFCRSQYSFMFEVLFLFFLALCCKASIIFFVRVLVFIFIFFPWFNIVVLHESLLLLSLLFSFNS